MNPLELPVPPLRLRRIHLHGVGPDGARFDPLDLDFATSGGAASRVLLSLTNTGGKSTLITLVSSIIVPAARSQIGGKNLGDYVLTGDTAHVVCEWEDTKDATRTITGTVMEWRDGRRQPAHAQRSTTAMHRAWYLWRTGPDLPGIDDLAFVTDGRRATFEQFTAAVTDLIADHPASQGFVTRKQGDWVQAVDARTNIDPVLFSYQMRMNDSESGAEKLLSSFDSDDNVVRFFLSALNDDRELADFTAKLGAYAEIAGDRPRLVALAGFGADAAPAVADVAAKARTARLEAGKAAGVRAQAHDHVASLVGRHDVDAGSLTELATTAGEAADELDAARRAYGQISDIRLQIQLEHARAKLTTALDVLQQRKDEATAAEADLRAWNLVDDVLAAQDAQNRLLAARAAYDAKDAGLSPLRGKVSTAAAAFAARLDTLIALGDTDVARFADRIKDVTTRQKALGVRERDLINRVRDLEAALETVDGAIAAADTAQQQARTAGWAGPGERPEDTLRRWTTNHTAAVDDAARHTDKAKTAEGRFDTLGDEIGALDDQLNTARLAFQEADARLGGFREDFANLDDDAVTELAGAAPDGPEAAERVASLAEDAARSADSRASIHHSAALDADTELAHLDTTGTAPAGADVLAVLDTISAAGIGAVTGLEWVEHNITDPDARSAYIAGNPDLAGGVVVSDPSRFPDAVATITNSPPRTRTPVTVTAGAHAGRPSGTDGSDVHVVVPHRATWDKQWAAELRVELEAISRDEHPKAAAARAAAAQARGIVAACREAARRWVGWSLAQLEDDARVARGAVDELEGQKTKLGRERAGERKAAEMARAAAAKAVTASHTAAGNIERAKALIVAVTAGADAAERRPVVTSDLLRARNDLAGVDTTREELAAEYDGAVNDRAQAKAATGELRRERLGLAVEASEDPGGNVDTLRAACEALASELRSAEAGIAEAATVERLTSELTAAEGRLCGIDPDLIAAAEHHGSSLAGASLTARREHQTNAGQKAEAAVKARGEAEAGAANARLEVERSAPASSSHQNHFDLANTPEWNQESFADVTDLLSRLEGRSADLLARRQTAETAETEARELYELVDADVQSFADTIAMWPDTVPASDAPFTGPRDSARTEMRLLLGELAEAERARDIAAGALRDAIAAVREVANDRRWLRLEEAVALRLRKLNDDQLVAESEGLAHSIEVLRSSAVGDLDDLDKHRYVLRDGLVTLCRSQRRLLREVSRASKLPPGLGDLSGQPAVKISFEDAADDEAAGRLATRIDSWATELAENPKRASSAEQRNRWLTEAVRDTVVDRSRAGAWTINILKPRIDGHVSYTPPNRIATEFSGGQVLTLAVLVYCALSGVRSAHRVGGARPAGCLILDNPFGAASNATLIEMQHRLAAHTGLQLVCATGLHDAGVDAAFSGAGSVIIKLRNDGDVRRNLSFLRLRSALVDGVEVDAALTGGRSREAEQNWVEGIRYEVGG